MEKVSAFRKPVISDSNRDGFEIAGSLSVGSGIQAMGKIGAGDGI